VRSVGSGGPRVRQKLECSAGRMCDTRRMNGSGVGRALSRGVSIGSALWLAGGLSGCASQQASAQALTIAGAAAVMVGASMASDTQCANAGDVGGPAVYCAPSKSSGARHAGTALAAAGVGVAAAGYALMPRGPDRLQAAPASAAGSSYRLIRATPSPGSAEGSTDGSEAVPPESRCPSSGNASPGASAEAAPPSECSALGSEEAVAAPAPPEVIAPARSAAPEAAEPKRAQPGTGDAAPIGPGSELR
jgi:pilus assembly protein FimV